MHPWSLGRLLTKLGLSRQKTRPLYPGTDPAAAAALKKAPRIVRSARLRTKKRVRVFFQDEARIGQKGRTCHVRWRCGERPRGIADKHFTFAYKFAAVEPGTDNAFALILPFMNTEAMQLFLDRFSATIAVDEHVAMVLDQAGWPGAKALHLPPNITLVPLPPYCPELNSHRLHADYDAIAEAASQAWNRLVAEAGRLASLCSYRWIPGVK